MVSGIALVLVRTIRGTVSGAVFMTLVLTRFDCLVNSGNNFRVLVEGPEKSNRTDT